MKTISTKLTIATFSVSIILLLTSAINQDAGQDKYATLRISEAGDSNSKMAVVYENGKIEEFEMDSWGSKTFNSNSLKINQALNMLASKGYDLVSSTGGDYMTNYTFVKK